MKNTYVVTFPPGAAGRFLSSVLWSLIQQQIDKTPLTNNNSSHGNNPGFFTCRPDNLIKNGKLRNNDPFTYLYFNTTKNNNNPAGAGLLFTHAVIDFDIFRSRPELKDTKIIIINTLPSDIHERSLNAFFKNYLDDNDKWLLPDKSINFKKNFIENYSALHKNINFTFTLDDFFIDDIFTTKKIIEKGQLEEFKRFVTHRVKSDLDLYKIPEDFKEKTLMINYNDIHEYENGFPITLKQLIDFTKVSSSDEMNSFLIKKYKMYSQGRRQLIEKFKFYKLI
jgi:hypothetical protein